MIAMMAHPVDRFVSAFHQMFATSDRRGHMCGFLRCAPGSEFSRRYVAGNVTLDDAAMWPRWESELAAGANWATKMLGLDGATLKWDSLVNFMFRVKENIMPLQNAEISPQ